MPNKYGKLTPSEVVSDHYRRTQQMQLEQDLLTWATQTLNLIERCAKPSGELLFNNIAEETAFQIAIREGLKLYENHRL